MNNNTIKAMFESFVNSERCKTQAIVNNSSAMFESFVNSERCKTILLFNRLERLFESFVNSERYKTLNLVANSSSRLRALLIQKDVKQIS